MNDINISPIHFNNNKKKKKKKRFTAHLSRSGWKLSLHPAALTTLLMVVYAKTTLGRDIHALPKYVSSPVPVTRQWTNENPVFSEADCLPCAVITVIPPSPSTCNSVFCTKKFVLQYYSLP
jgi:hypothetical protein